MTLLYKYRLKWIFKKRNYKIHKTVKFNHTLKIGNLSELVIHKNTNIYSNVTFRNNGKLFIGKHCIISEGAYFITKSYNINSIDKLPYGINNKDSSIIINDYCWIGANVTILPNVIIGSGAVIGASSVVRENVKALEIVIGNPALSIGSRNTNNYYLALNKMDVK